MVPANYDPLFLVLGGCCRMGPGVAAGVVGRAPVNLDFVNGHRKGSHDKADRRHARRRIGRCTISLVAVAPCAQGLLRDRMALPRCQEDAATSCGMKWRAGPPIALCWTSSKRGP
jgi:hypothetical protein